MHFVVDMWRMRLLAGFGPFLGLACGCAPVAGPAVRLTGSDGQPFSMVTQAATGGSSVDADATMRWFAAGGEWLGVPLTVRAGPDAGGGGLSAAARWQGVSMQLGPFAGGDGRTIELTSKVYRIMPTPMATREGWQIRFVPPGQWPSNVYDVLIPADAPNGGAPWSVSNDEPLSIWLDVNVPPGTPAGEYRSAIQVLSGGKEIQSTPLSLTVLPFDLPSEVGVSLLARLDHENLFRHHVTYQGSPFAPRQVWSDSPKAAELDQLLNRTCLTLLDHRISPLLPRLTPVVKVSAGGALAVNWDEYDRVMAPLLGGLASGPESTMAARWCQIPLDRAFPVDWRKTKLSESPSSSKVLRSYLSEAALHFREKGWLSRAFVDCPVDVLEGGQAFMDVSILGTMVRDADPDLRLLAPLFPQDMGQYGWWKFQNQMIEDRVDIWCPPATYFEPEAMNFQRQINKQTWFAPDRPPYSPSISAVAPAVHSRALAWLAYRYKCSAIMLPGACSWANRESDGSPSALLYPGSIAGMNEPLPSMRLKQLRRGIQDLAYLRLAEQHGLNFMSDSLAESLVPFGFADAYGAHYADGRWPAVVDDDRWWNLAHALLADAVGDKFGGGGLSDFDSALEWQRMMNETRTWSVTVEGVRLRPTAAVGEGSSTVQVTLSLNNSTRLPLTGRFSWVDLPAGWAAVGGEKNASAPPGARQPVLLALETGILSWDANGVRSLKCQFETDDGRRLMIDVRLAYTVAQRVGRGPVIDGDLGDWSPLATRHAGDFRWISDPSLAGGGEREGPQATDVFVARDVEYLYFGIQCFGEGFESGSSEPGNRIRYDDLIPVGEDLVEILIDPFNTGTFATQDLYHVAIKPTGAVAERGIATNPPVGPREPWPIDLQYSVRRRSDRWIAEVRLPLSAFPESAATSEVWGMNFTRFDRGRQEYSTWSGARHHAYKPLALGNVAVFTPEPAAATRLR